MRKPEIHRAGTERGNGVQRSREPRRRVLIVGSLDESLINFRGELIREMTSLGHEVHAAAPQISAAVRARLQEIRCKSHEVPMARASVGLRADSRTFLALISLFRQLEPDVVLAYTIKPVVYGIWAATLCRVETRAALVTGVGFSAGTHAAARLSRALYESALKRASHVFFQNTDDATLFGFSGDQFTLVNGSGVDIARFAPAPMPSSEAIKFLMIARLLRAKGIREYADAARRVKATGAQAEFHLVGWLDDNPDSIAPEELRRWIDGGTIVFHGRQSDVRPAIAGSHVYVLPSYREGTPRSVLEAAAMGRPIITTSAPGCRETVRDGHNGFLVPPRDSEALAAAMLHFIEKPECIELFGQRSRALAETKYDVKGVNSRILDTLSLSS